jgi:hypothetical protein
MRSSLPAIILVALSILAIIGVMVLQAGVQSAVVQVNNTSTDDLAQTMYSSEVWIVWAIATVLFIIALYFALKTMT